MMSSTNLRTLNKCIVDYSFLFPVRSLQLTG